MRRNIFYNHFDFILVTWPVSYQLRLCSWRSGPLRSCVGLFSCCRIWNVSICFVGLKLNSWSRKHQLEKNVRSQMNSSVYVSSFPLSSIFTFSSFQFTLYDKKKKILVLLPSGGSIRNSMNWKQLSVGGEAFEIRSCWAVYSLSQIYTELHGSFFEPFCSCQRSFSGK